MKRYTTVHNRYHVVHPEEGLIGTSSRFMGAAILAYRWDNVDKTGYPEGDVTIFDNMAHYGAWQEWQKGPKGKWRAVRRRSRQGSE